MWDIKCRDCEEYRNEWCEKVMDSPNPDIIRGCQYYHEKDPDVIKVIRCKDCKWHRDPYHCMNTDTYGFDGNDFCSAAERREEGEKK